MRGSAVPAAPRPPHPIRRARAAHVLFLYPAGVSAIGAVVPPVVVAIRFPAPVVVESPRAVGIGPAVAVRNVMAIATPVPIIVASAEIGAAGRSDEVRRLRLGNSAAGHALRTGRHRS